MKEEEIRPQDIFDEYLALAREDAVKYFGDVERADCACPACESDGIVAFKKDGFCYDICPFCETLFVNPRPDASAFEQYYTQSPSSRYWATTFYKKTADARREKLWKPKAKLVWDIVRNSLDEDDCVLVDIGGGYGLFAEEIKGLSGKNPIVIEPSPHLAKICRDKSIVAIEKFLEDVDPYELPNGSKAFVCFELFEHLHDPALFLNQLHALMSRGDLFIFTTLSGLGVDIRVLWENSKSVSPPHHLNFFNPKSIKLLLMKFGFGDIVVTTPGKLDIDILYNNREMIKDRFWKSFVANATERQKNLWQSIIAESGWSSHMMVVCKRVD